MAGTMRRFRVRAMEAEFKLAEMTKERDEAKREAAKLRGEIEKLKKVAA